MSDQPLRAVGLVCSLKPSPAPSSSALIAEQVVGELKSAGVETELVRCVDHNIAPGVEDDMGAGDEWPDIRRKVLDADILLISTPVWLGHPSSVTQRVLERLDAELSNTDDDGTPAMVGKVAIVSVVGNEDGAHKVVADVFQALNDIGFSVPAQGCTYWNGPAMQGTDYNDLDEVPDQTASATAAAARNAAHLARTLKAQTYPPYET
ncbi:MULTISPECIES: flavodoxin family protein [Mycobacterium]|uniref:Flavodoxin n=1 Tax=Mycobacterium gordonae TaxID=1778 RepID=A0A1X1W0H1_MYCGO|nr:MULTISPECIES: NAD(P)H-dependent oxidoreductase [Mycobacterium]MBX9982193.1 NAD(P)H-dependent oxidoreductase [Mycobacterium gordonae]MCQ4363671.1 NAD(P)H-dependent oxidoreductase [Mycobacterium gordonae]MCV7007181.1 NAD(P)H-dependent oxidoreductase [Mycobacterium gordonae]ODR24542.1 flavodoxin [Mycobacterium gordonae]ORV78720.1 flavodoxin [Mycobacterium gordonae]